MGNQVLANEADWLSRAFGRHLNSDCAPVIDLGSGTATMREDIQPHVGQLLAGVIDAGVTVITADLRDGPGVDIVGDVFDPAIQEQLRSTSPRSVFLFNILEHVTNPSKLASILVELIPTGGLIFVSVPYSFPYHPDPIDTMFRPGPMDLLELFPGAELVEGEIVSCGTYGDQLRVNQHRAVRDAAGLALPYPSVDAWRSRRDRFRYLRRPYQVTCAILRVGENEHHQDVAAV